MKQVGMVTKLDKRGTEPNIMSGESLKKKTSKNVILSQSK